MQTQLLIQHNNELLLRLKDAHAVIIAMSHDTDTPLVKSIEATIKKVEKTNYKKTRRPSS
jgi:hypothetical protein